MKADDKTAGRIECANELLSAGFVQVPIVVLRDHDLSAGAKLVYGALLWYLWRGGTYPGQVAMADEFGIGERSVRRHLAELEAQGYLTVKRHGLGQANTYTILCPWEQSPDRPKWPVKAAKAAGQTGKIGRSSRVVDSDVKEDRSLSHTPAPENGALVGAFFAALGIPKPAAKARERAAVIITDLTAEGFTAEALQEAFRLAADRGARGPDLLPFLVGEGQAAVERRKAQQAHQQEAQAPTQAAEDRHREDLARVDRLTPAERSELEAQARATLGIDRDRNGATVEAVVQGWIAARLRGT